MPRVTILMPVYNGERFLKETIDNVLCQTYTDFLFLIINDGSVDNTEKIILSYDDPRIIYHDNKNNLGLVATLNKGIEMVDTEFMARMDADDLWEVTKLEKQVNLLDKQPEVGICGTGIHKFGAVDKNFIFPVENEYLKAGFLFYNMMSHPSVVFRMSFLRDSGLRYKPDFFPAEDYKMWVDALQLTHIYNIPEILVYYRQHGSQITQAGNTVQQSVSGRIRLELLRRIYPDVSQEEELFFQTVFADLKFNSLSDYKKSKDWIKKLLAENKKTNYVQQAVLKKELNRYLRIGYKAYVLNLYFPEYSIKAAWKYFISWDWIHLSLKNNLKLLFRSILKR